MNVNRRSIDLAHDARKFLDTLPPKQFRQVVSKMLDLLSDPHPIDSKSLKGSVDFRVDVGEYRIVYRMTEQHIRITKIGKRNDGQVYR